MPQIDWTNHYMGMSDEEFRVEFDKYSRRGFSYGPFDKVFLQSSYVRTPSGVKLTQLQMEKIFSRKLVFGDREQIEVLDALEFFKICMAWLGKSTLQ